MIVPAYINETDIQKPFLAIFTKKRVKAGDELTFDYAPVDENSEEKVRF